MKPKKIKYLYPLIKPYEVKKIKTSDNIYELHVELFGNPDGIPVIFIHGGPGGGTSKYAHCFFDPKYYKIVTLDQRGCGKTVPQMSLVNNTSQHLVEDLELVRKTLNIDKWILFGGSWGSTLSLLYAIKYPQNILTMVLRGVFLTRKIDIDWLYQQGASFYKPFEFERYQNVIEPSKRHNMVHAYHELMHCGDPKIREKALLEWAYFESASASVKKYTYPKESEDKQKYFEIALIENHFFFNDSFMPENYILDNSKAYEEIPTFIVHGEYDWVTLPEGAYLLSKKLKNCNLKITRRAGHSVFDTNNRKELVKIMDELKLKFS
ncbi:prolyl aminopeptidase [Mycoplasmopsis opalescens]|uniref:prolyl aminopeptidase n=1 Tax=Mycoplasmopsis opalescens TaxID=114886 RepID=UPI0004A7143F|nr:prolyl aminopeptidase [Mycoplasmopsis opalescens]